MEFSLVLVLATTQINLMTFIGFYFLYFAFYNLFQFVTIAA
jgi:hypothetical protein